MSFQAALQCRSGVMPGGSCACGCGCDEGIAVLAEDMVLEHLAVVARIEDERITRAIALPDARSLYAHRAVEPRLTQARPSTSCCRGPRGRGTRLEGTFH